MMKKLLGAAVLAATAVVAHAETGGGPTADLAAAVAVRDWNRGGAVCEGLAQSEAKRPDRRQLSTVHYAQLAAYCAALASGSGDADGAAWWWFTAVSMNSKAARALLPGFLDLGLLKSLPPPRQLTGRSFSAKRSRDQVLLPSGQLVSGTAPAVALRPEVPRYLFSSVPGVARTDVKIEVLVGEDGVPREPLLISAHALPLHAFLAFHYLRGWRFTPAVVDGRPVISAFQLAVSTSRD